MAIAKLLLVLVASTACRERYPPQHSTPPARPAAQVVIDPHLPLRLDALGTPVRSARMWTTALAPNRRGGWNFITQVYEYQSTAPTEFVVVDLAAATSTITPGTSGRYAGSKYQVKNQLRAPNGRIFFPLVDTAIAYYDPTTERVTELPPLLPPNGPDKVIYDATFGPDGKLYAGTQSNGLPTILQIDPDTLKTRVLGHVGRDRQQYSYAYQLAVDPPWVYAAVGESPWELAALNIDTGESRILAMRSDRAWMTLEHRPEGIAATLITGLHRPDAHADHVWCADGKAQPEKPSKRPIGRDSVAPRAVSPMTGAPELELSDAAPDTDGVGRVRWRMPGDRDGRVTEYYVPNTTPIAIEALVGLPGLGVLGGTKQYHGFFRYDPIAKKTTVLGGPSPSRTVFAHLDGLVYFTGYPNGVLYAYDPRRPWVANGDVNPHRLGNFVDTDTKYGYFLVALGQRLYYAGRRERDGLGSGIGYYDPSTGQFVGHYDRLENVDPRGLVALPAIGELVFSGQLRTGSATTGDATLIVYDRDLVERERLLVKPGLTDPGELFATPTRGVIVGLVKSAHAVYRYDVVAKKLLDWKELPEAVGAVAQHATDHSLWITEGASLVRIDPRTLDATVFGAAGSLPAGVEHLAWQGPDLYLSAGSQLYRIERVGLR